MKQYSVLISLIIIFLYSMDEDIEIIQFETPLMEEKKYESLNEENERTCFYHDQQNNQYYTYDSTIHHTQGYIKDVAWHPTEHNKLLTITDENVLLWNTKKNENPLVCISSQANTRGFNCIAVSDDGSRAVFGGSNMLFEWDFLKNETLKIHILGPYYDFLKSHAVTKAAFIPKDNDIIISLFRGNLNYSNDICKNVITIKNIHNKKVDIISTDHDSYTDMAIHPLNKNMLIVVQQDYHMSKDSSFVIFDIEHKEIKHTKEWDIDKIACNPTNEAMIATGGWWDPYVSFWDMRKKGLIIGSFETQEYSDCVDLQWRADGNSIVVSFDNCTKLFDRRTGRCIEKFPNRYSFLHAINCCVRETGQHKENIKGMRMHLQDQTLLTFSKNSIKLWNNTK